MIDGPAGMECLPDGLRLQSDRVDFRTAGGLSIQALALMPQHRAQVKWLLRRDEDCATLCASDRHVRADTLANEWYDARDTACSFLLATYPEGMPVGLLCLEHGRVSYLVELQYRAQGIASAALRWLSGHVSPGQLPLHAQVDRNNVASRRALEAAGFRFVGLASGHAHSAPLLNFVRR
ncbi:GNAT family N-acetyltransferase [Telluria beijingensis]|uniref:GNAT family N-acetyltransferase n=1 Tax=Telluria beijingensis TaxID=3068633 RepID=UPI002795C00A|nr:GNAT family protein [Massilia sp. REN29]